MLHLRGLGVMGVNGWRLVISSFKPQYVLFSFSGPVNWNGMNEGRRDKETSDASKTQLYYYYRRLQLSLEGRRPPRAIKSPLSLVRSKFFLPEFLFWRLEASFFPSMLRLFFLSETSREIVISFIFLLFAHFFIKFYFIIIGFIYCSIPTNPHIICHCVTVCLRWPNGFA